MKVILCFALLVVAVSGGYDSHHGAYSTGSFDTIASKKFVKIIRLVGSTDNAGNYNFDSESADGTKMAETGGLKVIKGETGATKAGSVSWTSPEGEHFSLTYTADENGFRPVATHLPVAPPMPEEIQRMLPLLPKLDLSQYDNEKPMGRPHHHHSDYSHVSSFVVPMKPVPPPKPVSTHVFAIPSPPSSFMALPPSPPASTVEVLQPLEAPTKTHVETSEFIIDSEPARTFFRIGH